jgi:uncharacterized repeat protein (TIGR01451 family)
MPVRRLLALLLQTLALALLPSFADAFTGPPLPQIAVPTSSETATALTANSTATTVPTASRTTTPTPLLVDLSVVKAGSFTVIPEGRLVTYTITVQNLGGRTSSEAIVTDTLHAGMTLQGVDPMCSPPPGTPQSTTAIICHIAPLAPGASFTFTLTALVGPCATLDNTASVTSQDAEINTNNNTASITELDRPIPSGCLTPTRTATSTPTLSPPDLALQMIIAPYPPPTGQPLTYLLTVSNVGGQPSGSTSLTDNLPATITFVSADPGCTFIGGVVTCLVPSLQPGQSVTYTLRVSTAPLDPCHGPPPNSAIVASIIGEVNTTNNTSSVVILIDCLPTATPPPSTAFSIETHADTVFLHFPAASAPNFQYVRWNGGVPEVRTGSAGLGPVGYQDMGAAPDGFVCYAPIFAHGTGDVLCAMPVGAMGDVNIGLGGLSASVWWQPSIAPSYIAVVPLNGEQTQVSPINPGQSAFGHTPNGPTCYALLNGTYGLKANPVCAAPGTAATFNTTGGGDFIGSGLPGRP